MRQDWNRPKDWNKPTFRDKFPRENIPDAPTLAQIQSLIKVGWDRNQICEYLKVDPEWVNPREIGRWLKEARIPD